MKNIVGIIVLLVASFLFFACKNDKKNDPEPSPATVNFIIENTVDGQSMQMNQLIYTNAAGNLYSIDLLKYYLSNLVFVKDDNSEVAAPNYELIDESVADSKIFSVELPVGNYKKLKFYMGVDSLRNVSGAQAGELSPNFGMFWDWNTGYIYFKHEGSFIDDHNDLQVLTYHYGAIQALVKYELDIAMNLDATPKTIVIKFDLNKLYEAPNLINFNGNNVHSGDPVWLQSLKENFPNAFTIKEIY